MSGRDGHASGQRLPPDRGLIGRIDPADLPDRYPRSAPARCRSRVTPGWSRRPDRGIGGPAARKWPPRGCRRGPRVAPRADRGTPRARVCAGNVTAGVPLRDELCGRACRKPGPRALIAARPWMQRAPRGRANAARASHVHGEIDDRLLASLRPARYRFTHEQRSARRLFALQRRGAWIVPPQHAAVR